MIHTLQKSEISNSRPQPHLDIILSHIYLRLHQLSTKKPANLIAQSMRHFKKFNADKYLRRQNTLVVMMYSFVQAELNNLGVLKKHFVKEVTIKKRGRLSLKKS